MSDFQRDQPVDENRNRNEADLQDSLKDQERIAPEEVILDLPEVSDIPGQENIVPPKMNAFADTTASSDDEEGRGLLDSDMENEDDN